MLEDDLEKKKKERQKRKKKKREFEWTEKAETRKVRFLATGGACKSTLWLHALKREKADIFWFSAEGA